MLVCNCADVEYDDLLELVKEHGNNIDAIQEACDAGTICESCMEDDCDIVDLPLHQAIKKAMKEINQE